METRFLDRISPWRMAHRTVESAFVIFRLPQLFTCLRKVDDQRCIVDHGCRRKALFQSGGVNKRFETGAGLPPGLGDMVELVAIEIESAYQCVNRPVARIRRNESGFDLGQLGDLPRVLFVFVNADQRSDADAVVQSQLVTQGLLRETQSFTADFNDLARPCSGR